MLVHHLWEEYMYTPWSHRGAWLSQSIKTISFKQQQAMIIITIIISLSVSVLVHFQVIPRNYNNNIVIVIVITIIISVSIFPSISQELQGKCKSPLFEAQQQSITNYIPPVECIFYSLPGFWIGCFSCYGKVVRILQCDFVQASISLNKKQ